MKLSELVSNVEIIDSNLSSDPEINNLCTNSFEVEKGDVFIAVAGSEHDGHDFICIAHERGAVLIVTERMTPYLEKHSEIDFILVKSTRLAVSHMWNAFCGRPSDKMIFVAVTGTNGKTSTTYFLREIFNRAGYITGVVGTVKCFSGSRTDVIGESHVNSMTTPPPEKLYPELARMVSDGVEIVFLEASSHALAQYRLDPINFALAIFTNLTPEHLDYHGDMDSYFNAKLRLLKLSDCALVNADDKWMSRIVGYDDIPIKTFSVESNADFRAIEARCRIDFTGIAYGFSENASNIEIECPIEGKFMIYNTLAAASAARLFAVRPQVIKEALVSMPQIPGRMEHLSIPNDFGFEVYIDYAHTPEALKLALDTLKARKKPNGRIIVLFGCGGDRDSTKRPAMGRIASENSDLTVITSDNSRSENPRTIIFDIIRGIADRSNCCVIEKRECAINYALNELCKDDILLLAGKGHEDYEIDSFGKHSFSERDIVNDFIEMRKSF